MSTSDRTSQTKDVPIEPGENSVSSDAVSLRSFHAALDTGFDAALEAGLGSEDVCWLKLVADVDYDTLVDFSRLLLRSVEHEDAPQEVRQAALRYFAAGFTCRSVGLTFALCAFLSRARPNTQEANATILKICHLWLDSGAVGATVTSLIDKASDQIPFEAKPLCARWLTALADHLAVFCNRRGTSHFNELTEFCVSLPTVYAKTLVTGLLQCWHTQYYSDHMTDVDLAAGMVAQLALRGEACRLAATLCAECLTGSHLAQSDSLVTFGGLVVQKLLEVSVAGACNLFNNVLDALTILVFTNNQRCLKVLNKKSKELLPSLLSGAPTALEPILWHLGDRLWKLSVATRLTAAVIYFIVDVLSEQQSWLTIRYGWFQRWADAGMLKSADAAGERVLALRIARALCKPGQLQSADLHLLLQGVHVRLGAPVPESRWLGMAVAEVMARRWPYAGAETTAGETQLHFDGFDLTTCGLSDFLSCDSEFDVVGDAFSCSNQPLPDDAGQAAALLHEMIFSQHSRSEIGDFPQGLNTSISHIGTSPTKDTLQVSTSGEPGSAGLGTCTEKDSDDEDDDDPLHGISRLPPLQAPADSCEDLRLVQPPALLRSAYEMLLGPAKDESARNALLKCEGVGASADDSSGGTRQEPPAKARARIVAAVSALPDLVRTNPPDLQYLTEPLCARLLHMGGDTPGVEDIESARRSSLVALLSIDGSRRVAASFLIGAFASEDIALASRLMVLDALSNAAKVLSHRSDQPEVPVGAARNLPATDGGGRQAKAATVDATRDRALDDKKLASRTRRFASATKIIPSKPNHFAAEMRAFLFPLLFRWRQPDKGAAQWATREPMLIGPVLQCAGVLLECGGSGSPDRNSAVSKCLDLVEEFNSHGDPFVRRCALFVLSRTLIVGAAEQVLSRENLFEWLESALMREGDDTCRKMLAGILSWFRQYGAI